MGGDLLNIGRSGLFAAQVGLATTGHNIANANVAGYSRQVVTQESAKAQDLGYGFIGAGTMVSTVKRYSDSFLNAQVRTAQSSSSSLDTYIAQINQVDNLLSDTTAGLSPALQDFFKGVQDVASNPSSVASRQALLSTADSLAARFQGLDGRLTEIREGVNAEITSSVTLINSYASQIAMMNEQISDLASSTDKVPNDLLDKRDQMIAELNQHVKATAVPGSNNTITVQIGTGQPLVVGEKAFELVAINSPTDLTRVQVGYANGRGVTVLADDALAGGKLGGLLSFRSEALDRAQNSLGRIAIGLAITFNGQHRLGIDSAGVAGGDFFRVAPAFVGASTRNALASTTEVGAVVVDPAALSQSDYMVQFDGINFNVTRLSDNQKTVVAPYPQVGPQVIDGVAFSINGVSTTGDSFLVRPTIAGAGLFQVQVSDRSKIAAAAPVVTGATTSNTGKGLISEGAINADYLAAPLAAPVTLTFDADANELAGFPMEHDITVTVNGVPTVYPAGTPSVPYTDGATITFGGISFSMTGQPAMGDTFSIGPNISGVGDNRNMRLLGELQTRPIFDGGTATYQSAYAEMINFIGNKTREVQVNGQASEALLAQAREAQQDVSGVNLDEEATNLLRYQQAYQAAGKVMQIASQLFDVLVGLGR
jgi:flagellar hook-associated protein 1 FlgK